LLEGKKGKRSPRRDGGRGTTEFETREERNASSTTVERELYAIEKKKNSPQNGGVGISGGKILS